MILSCLDYQSSTRTNDEASTDDQSDQGEPSQYSRNGMQRRPNRGRFRQRGTRGARSTAIHGPSRSRGGFGTSVPWGYFDPYADVKLPSYYAAEKRGGWSRGCNRTRLE
jgi:hypothetical protein